MDGVNLGAPGGTSVDSVMKRPPIEGVGANADNSHPATETLPPPEGQTILVNKPEALPPLDAREDLGKVTASDVPSNELPKIIDGVGSGPSQEQPSVGQRTPESLEDQVARNGAEGSPAAPSEPAKPEISPLSDSMPPAETPDAKFADVPSVVSAAGNEPTGEPVERKAMTREEMREELRAVSDRIDEIIESLKGEK